MSEGPLIETRAYPDRVLTDRHTYHQLLLGQQGCLELEAGGRGAQVAAGILAPIPADTEHHYLAPGANTTLVLDLPVAWCEALQLGALFERGPRRLPDPLWRRGRTLPGQGPEVLAAWLGEVLHTAGASLHEPRVRLLRLLPELEADLARPWRVAELAARCHLAEAAFARQFRALTGQPPHAWLVARRLARARTLMDESGASLTEIALACGFGDAAHFSRVFRSRHGLSPRQWRSHHGRPVRRSSPSR